jgi:hypothetical protein
VSAPCLFIPRNAMVELRAKPQTARRPCLTPRRRWGRTENGPTARTDKSISRPTANNAMRKTLLDGNRVSAERETRYGAVLRHDRLQGPRAKALVLGRESLQMFRHQSATKLVENVSNRVFRSRCPIEGAHPSLQKIKSPSSHNHRVVNSARRSSRVASACSISCALLRWRIRSLAARSSFSLTDCSPCLSAL